MGRGLILACWLCGLLTAKAGQCTEDSISLGWGYSAGTYGEDRSGIHLWSLAGELGVFRSVGAVGRAYHGRFTDYPSIGRIYVTPIGLGPRLYILRERLSPYIEVLGGIVNFGYGVDGDHLEVGVQVGAGVTGPIAGVLGLDVGAVYLHTGDWELNYYDAGPVPIPGLDHIALTAAISLRLGK